MSYASGTNFQFHNPTENKDGRKVMFDQSKYNNSIVVYK